MSLTGQIQQQQQHQQQQIYNFLYKLKTMAFVYECECFKFSAPNRIQQDKHNTVISPTQTLTYMNVKYEHKQIKM